MIAGTYAGLRWGEAPARSFLVPRNGTAEFVVDAPPLRFGSVEWKGC